MRSVATLKGSELSVQRSGFRVEGSGCRVQGSGCRVQGEMPGSERFQTAIPESGVDDAASSRVLPVI